MLISLGVLLIPTRGTVRRSSDAAAIEVLRRVLHGLVKPLGRPYRSRLGSLSKPARHHQ